MGRSFVRKHFGGLFERVANYLDGSKEKKRRIIPTVAGAAENFGLDDHVDQSISVLKGKRSEPVVAPPAVQEQEEETAVISCKV